MSGRNPDYQFLSTDTAEIVRSMEASYEAEMGITLRKASPERLLLQWFASIIAQERAQQNVAINQNVPSRAEGDHLDALAELYFAQERPKAQKARATMRFSVSEAQQSAILVPAGTRVTDEGQELYWETMEDAYIKAGEDHIDLEVICQTAGTVGNGWSAGKINTIVDVFDYYQSCANTAESDGGSEEAEDDQFYELLKASMYAYSTAGPTGAYEYHAKAVSTEIADVKAVQPRTTRTTTLTLYTLSESLYAFLGGDYLKEETLKVYPHGGSTAATIETDYTASYTNGLLVISIDGDGALASETSIDVSIEVTEDEAAGRVDIYVLMDDGTIADTTMKNRVLEACSSSSVRPLTDLVSVKDPETVSYSIDITYYIPAQSDKSASEIEKAVAAAVTQYTSWQSAKLGRDINPSRLIGLIMQAGVDRVVVRSPSYTALHDGEDGIAPQVAELSGTPTVLNGGVGNG